MITIRTREKILSSPRICTFTKNCNYIRSYILGRWSDDRPFFSSGYADRKLKGLSLKTANSQVPYFFIFGLSLQIIIYHLKHGYRSRPFSFVNIWAEALPALCSETDRNGWRVCVSVTRIYILFSSIHKGVTFILSRRMLNYIQIITSGTW